MRTTFKNGGVQKFKINILQFDLVIYKQIVFVLFYITVDGLLFIIDMASFSTQVEMVTCTFSIFHNNAKPDCFSVVSSKMMIDMSKASGMIYSWSLARLDSSLGHWALPESLAT